MPECPLCSGPVARRGHVCTACDLERAFGTGDYPDDDAEEVGDEA